MDIYQTPKKISVWQAIRRFLRAAIREDALRS